MSLMMRRLLIGLLIPIRVPIWMCEHKTGCENAYDWITYNKCPGIGDDFSNRHSTQEFLESYLQELMLTLQESRVVRTELENLLNQAVLLSDQIAEKLEYQALVCNQSSNIDGPCKNDALAADEAVHTNRDISNQQAAQQSYNIESGLPLLNEQVVALYKDGYSIKDIASMLNRGQGEISLILNITNQRRVI